MSNFFTVLPSDVLETQSKKSMVEYFPKIINALQPLTIFAKKAPS